ncbi:MAG: hypothetical protein ACYDH5_19355 [Acidimicrobiales bacterium]
MTDRWYAASMIWQRSLRHPAGPGRSTRQHGSGQCCGRWGAEPASRVLGPTPVTVAAASQLWWSYGIFVDLLRAYSAERHTPAVGGDDGPRHPTNRRPPAIVELARLEQEVLASGPRSGS